jgi:hypothetical protein
LATAEVHTGAEELLWVANQQQEVHRWICRHCQTTDLTHWIKEDLPVVTRGRRRFAIPVRVAVQHPSWDSRGRVSSSMTKIQVMSELEVYSRKFRTARSEQWQTAARPCPGLRTTA